MKTGALGHSAGPWVNSWPGCGWTRPPWPFLLSSPPGALWSSTFCGLHSAPASGPQEDGVSCTAVPSSPQEGGPQGSPEIYQGAPGTESYRDRAKGVIWALTPQPEGMPKWGQGLSVVLEPAGLGGTVAPCYASGQGDAPGSIHKMGGHAP